MGQRGPVPGDSGVDKHTISIVSLQNHQNQKCVQNMIDSGDWIHSENWTDK